LPKNYGTLWNNAGVFWNIALYARARRGTLQIWLVTSLTRTRLGETQRYTRNWYSI